jgi:hypothetical protein
MILTLNRDSFHQQRFLICLSGSIDEATFLRRGKVKPGTYAGDLLANLHDTIFHRSLELKRDYERYYAIEYPTFAKYVRKRFLFPWEVVSTASAQFSRSRHIFYFRPGYYFLHDDYGQEFLEKLLEPRRTK